MLSPLTYVSERDIDLLLVEELICSPSFLPWLWAKAFPGSIGSEPAFRHVKVRHSITEAGEGGGESDITVEALVAGGGKEVRTLLLLENKINAPFQPAQPERYKTRARLAVESQAVEHALCILAAPQDYLDQARESEAFDATLSYEDIAAYFEERAKEHMTADESASRYLLRKALLGQAIQKQRQDRQLQFDPEVTAFWQGYYELARQHAPGLKMKPPGPRGRLSTWVYFSRALPKSPPLPSCEVVHRLDSATMELNFQGWGHRKAALQAAAITLPPGSLLTEAGKSLAIRTVVPVLDVKRPANEQFRQIQEGLAAAVGLQAWFHQHRTTLLAFAEGRNQHSLCDYFP